MKKIHLIIILSLITTSFIKAQEYRTVFSNVSHYGWYGSAAVNYTELNNSDALIIGGSGAWIIDHYLSVGAAGFGFIAANELNPNLSDKDKYKLGGGYGGLLIMPILAPKSPVHLTFPLIMGAGGISYSKVLFDNWTDEDYKNIKLATESFFVIEPGVEIELNLVKVLRLSFGVYYRFTSDIILETESPLDANERIQLSGTDVLRGFSYGINFKIGRF